jgi:signal peptidase I
MEEDLSEIQSNFKRRRPWLAFMQSFIAPGLGQFYNGQPSLGLKFLFAYFLLYIPFVSLALLSFKGLVAAIFIVLGYHFFVSIEAAMRAAKVKTIAQNRFQKWYFYCAFIVFVNVALGCGNYGVTKLVTRYYMRIYILPTESMLPNIHPGDRVVTDLTYCKSKDFTRTIGDIVVFRGPKGTYDYIKRVIALPQERITIYQGTVYINGQPLNEPWELAFDPNVSLQAELYAKYAVGDEYIVPDGHVFLLGDNRDHSMDSRHWGAVDVNKIKGKVLYIFWSKDKSRIGKKIE